MMTSTHSSPPRQEGDTSISLSSPRPSKYPRIDVEGGITDSNSTANQSTNFGLVEWTDGKRRRNSSSRSTITALDRLAVVLPAHVRATCVEVAVASSEAGSRHAAQEDSQDEDVDPGLQALEEELTCGMCAGVFIDVKSSSAALCTH